MRTRVQWYTTHARSPHALTHSAAVVCLAPPVGIRGVDGYLNIIVFRYIAHTFPRHEQAVTVFFGGVLLALSFAGSLLTWALVETGFLSD